MSRRKERSKTGRDAIFRRDEPDAVSIHVGSSLSLQPERAEDCVMSLQVSHPSGHGGMNTLTPVQLTSESGSTGPNRVDSNSSVADLLIKLDEKINNLMDKSGNHDSNDKEVMDVQSEMKKLLSATLKQKEDFNRLLEIVKRQKQSIKKLEAASSRSGKLGFHAFEGPEIKLVSAIQCTQDREDPDSGSAQRVVFLIRGNHEFCRKMSQCGSESSLLDGMDIPDDINQGNRMLTGQRDYPHLLLDSEVVDRFVDSRIVRDLSVKQDFQPQDGRAADGSDNLLQCPVCRLSFPANETTALTVHVDSHFH